MTVRILEGDCRDVLRTLPDASVDAIVTDPPYELTSARKNGRSEATRGKVMGGFMGMQWDGTGVPFDPNTWRECLRVLKPGGHLLAFGGSRTYHRLACAVEDGGFEIRDQIMWLYGSGFPKSKNLDGDWSGWGTALKPAHEPIVVARKPLIGTVASNVQAHGSGALNIDGCRVGGDSGRWPANVVHDGSDEVLDAFARFGEKTSGKPSGMKAGNNNKVFGQFAGGIPVTGFGDTGTAARFFYCAKADREDRNVGCDDLPAKALNWSSVDQSPGTFQSANTDRTARNHHPTVKPTELMRWLVRLVMPPGGTVLDPFAGSGSTGRAADIEGFDAILIELNPEYAAIARKRIHGDAPLFAEVANA